MHDDPLDLTTSQLSAFLDGELAREEADLFVRRLERDARLQRSLASYALIGEIMRTPASSGGVIATRGFAARVIESIAKEAPPHAESAVLHAAPASAAQWLRPAVGLSIAAGVAVVAIGIFNRNADTVPSLAATADPPAAVAQGDLAEASYIVPEITVTGPLLPAARLTNYVMAHSEYSSPLGRRNVLSNMLADEPAPADAIIPAGLVPDLDPARRIQP